MVDENDVANDKQNKYPITISDWLVFLESNSQINLSIYVLIGGLIIALSISLSRKLTSIGTSSIISNIILGIFFILAMGILVFISKRAKLYQKLSQKIMEGEFTKPEDIRQEYRIKIRDTRKLFFK